MAKTVVIYRTTSGYTKRYAHWIAEELGADLVDRKDADIKILVKYDTIIYGGSLHAVGISGVDIIKKNLPVLADKKIIIFATGASPARKEIPAEILNRNFAPEEQKNIKFFYLRGGFDFQKLDLKSKLLMTLMKWKILLKREKSSDEKGMLEAFSKPVDFTDKGNIQELLEYARSLN